MKSMPLSRQLDAAARPEGVAGHEARFLAEKEADHRRHLLGCAQAGLASLLERTTANRHSAFERSSSSFQNFSAAVWYFNTSSRCCASSSLTRSARSFTQSRK